MEYYKQKNFSNVIEVDPKKHPEMKEKVLDEGWVQVKSLNDLTPFKAPKKSKRKVKKQDGK